MSRVEPPPSSASSKPEIRVEKVVCIACSREMDRLNFAARSGATIDVCNIHGIWLDAGELVLMLHFVKTRVELGEVPLSDEERQQSSTDVESELRVRALMHAHDFDLAASFVQPHLAGMHYERRSTLTRFFEALISDRRRSRLRP